MGGIAKRKMRNIFLTPPLIDTFVLVHNILYSSFVRAKQTCFNRPSIEHLYKCLKMMLTIFGIQPTVKIELDTYEHLRSTLYSL